jgi:5-methyltetrahydropteroyltriglutamate--homocysteine methyltransferase
VNNDFTATVLGSARIGPNRELKKAVESYWAGKLDAEALESVAKNLRENDWRTLAAGLDSVPVNTFSYYDQMLDTAALLGALPPRVEAVEGELDRYFAAARGTETIVPLEMTKWFDTNYHYLVPEISPETTFSLHPDKVLGEVNEARALGIPARPVIIGPITFLLLSKSVGSSDSLLGRVDELIPLYARLLELLAAAGAEWVQIDEPALVRDLDDETVAAATRSFEQLAASQTRPAILLASYFGDLGDALPAVASTGVEGLAIDLTVPGVAEQLAATRATSTMLVVAGVVDGRNVWRTDLDAALETLHEVGRHARAVAVSSSCSLLHVPYSLDAEPQLEPTLRSWLAFGNEKITEVSVLARALQGGTAGETDRFVSERFESARAALDSRRHDARLHDPTIRARVNSAAGRDRSPGDVRRVVQAEHLSLPVLPTTTIGSFPQTSTIRRARAALRSGTVDEAEYVRQMRAEIAYVMVQYFAEQLDGFVVTANGWVQSYGSRCVRPPILYGDVSRPAPMTVEWATYAQSLTDKPVKGMLTGPVTILAWSFVRDDIPAAESAAQIASAIRDETIDLESAGIRIVQVDEPALRELLPLRSKDTAAYLDWAVRSFRIATSGVDDATQIHTHLCYSEFGEVIDAIVALDADVTSIEAARSRMEVLDDLTAVGFALDVGPGVYDIHSPRVPTVAEITESLRAAAEAVPLERLWVNPDCGLKTRGPAEVEQSLRNMVLAAAALR